MLTTKWATSPREHEYTHERTHIVMRDGVKLDAQIWRPVGDGAYPAILGYHPYQSGPQTAPITPGAIAAVGHFAPGQESGNGWRSEEHTSELQSRENLVCRLLLEKKKHH